MDERLIRKLAEKTADEEILLQRSDEAVQRVYMDEGSNVISGHKMLGTEKLITSRFHPRFVHFPEHSHDFVEIVYMCKGSTTHIINGMQVVLGTGDLLFLSQNSRQEILPAGEDDLMINFIVRPHFFQGTLRFLGSEETPLRQFIVRCLCESAGSDYLLFRVAEEKPVQNLVENLLWMLVSEVPNRRSIDQLTMGLLFVHLLNCTDKLSVGSRSKDAIVHILRYVEENYASGSLTEIAEELHYDIAWLSREIKRKTGKSYTELMQEKRLSQAAWLLHNTRQKVSEIAVNVGYENVSYFHRIFAARFSMSPKKYRDMNPLKL